MKTPDGKALRERIVVPIVNNKTVAKEWAEQRERHLAINGKTTPHARPEKKEVPTFSDFAQRFYDSGVAEQLKPSAIATRESIMRVHLIPALGQKRLDQIEVMDVNDLKKRLAGREKKTVNNVLGCLSAVLKLAVEEKALERLPWTKLGIFKVDKADRAFYTFEQYRLLREVAEQEDWRANLVVLLGGDAGLRLGEMMALEWDDVGFGLGGGAGLLVVRQSEWKRSVTQHQGG